MRLILFLHFLGSALWIGGALAAMVVAIAARAEPPEVRAGAFRLLARVHTLVIGLGAVLAVATGVLLTMDLASAAGGSALGQPRIWVMQLTGLIGGLMVLFLGLPVATRMSALAVPNDAGELPPAFERYRRRQAVVSSVAGALAVLSLFSGVVFG